jgi:hypothetical protein
LDVKVIFLSLFVAFGKAFMRKCSPMAMAVRRRATKTGFDRTGGVCGNWFGNSSVPLDRKTIT